MNTQQLDQWIADARKQAAYEGRACIVHTAARLGVRFPAYDPAHNAPAGQNLADVLNADYGVLFVYPSGLVAGPDRVNWFWDFTAAGRGPRYYQGFARQAEQQCRRLKIETDVVWGVSASEIHGTCVFEAGKAFDPGTYADEEEMEWSDWWNGRTVRLPPLNPRDWRLVQAASF